MSLSDAIHLPADPLAAARAANDGEAIVKLMADAMVHHRGSKGAATELDLSLEGFSATEIIEFGPAARERARMKMLKRIEPVHYSDAFERFCTVFLAGQQGTRPKLGGLTTERECAEWIAYCQAWARLRLRVTMRGCPKFAIQTHGLAYLRTLPLCETEKCEARRRLVTMLEAL